MVAVGLLYGLGMVFCGVLYFGLVGMGVWFLIWVRVACLCCEVGVYEDFGVMPLGLGVLVL